VFLLFEIREGHRQIVVVDLFADLELDLEEMTLPFEFGF